MGRRRNGHDSEPGPGPADATREHNAGARKEAINKALEAMFQADQRAAAAIETHVQPYRQAKSDAKKVLREDYGISNEVIAARYAAYKVERQAELEGDEATQDLIREMWEALPVGGSVDLVDLAQAARGASA